MKRHLLAWLFCAALATLAEPAAAQVQIITAIGSGDCAQPYPSCGNPSPTDVGRTGTGARIFDMIYQGNDYFVFDIPVGYFDQATIQIWDPPKDPDNGVFNLYEATSLTYPGLTAGPLLATISGDDIAAHADSFINIDINPTGVALLQAAQGQRFFFGGSYNGTAVFYGQAGLAAPTMLVLTAPEPETWVLLIGGFGLAGAAVRRARKVAAG